MSGHSYMIACLAGDGIGPELMAEASRALAAVSRLHAFRVQETHPPFAAEAHVRSGRRLPRTTRQAALAADAVLVTRRDEALSDLESELDLRSSLTRVRFASGADLAMLSPLTPGASEWTVERAFALARHRRARVACVGGDSSWNDLVDAAAARHDGLFVERPTLARGLAQLRDDPAHFDVLVAPPAYGEAVEETATLAGDGGGVVASARLAKHGPSVFAPTHGAARDLAGFGVANPSAMLLAATLLLCEGLGERGAADTLLGAVGTTLNNGVRTLDLVDDGLAATTREFTDVVLGLLPSSLRNAEFVRAAP
jgi:3-isopropylmalate dehydrogenase